MTIDANLTRPGVVVLGDNWYPGWKAKVDGQPVDVERVDYVLRGTVAGRGHHRIEYSYQPASWRIGWIISLLSLLALAGAVVLERRRGSVIARRPTLVAALISLALAAAMVGPGLVPGRVLSSADIWWFSVPWAAERPADLARQANGDLADAARAFQPLRAEVKRQLPGAPLWDPWITSGRPLLADGQSAVFSPFNLPAWVMPLQDSLAWTALLILWAATFGMYLLARALGMSFAGGLMAGIVYGLNLWVVAHVSYPHDAVWALLPWVLWATERLVRRPDPGSVGPARAAGGVAVVRRPSRDELARAARGDRLLRVAHRTGPRQRRSRPAARHGGGAGGGHRPRRDRAGAVRRAAARTRRTCPSAPGAASTSTSIPPTCSASSSTTTGAEGPRPL